MTIKPETIKIKLAKLEEVVNLLERYRQYAEKDFINNPTLSGAAKYNLILGIEIIVDIGNHFLSEVYGAHPGEYREIIEMLGEHEIIPKEFSKENIDMAKFRNLLIHEYIKVDEEKVYNNLQKAPDIFRNFAKYYLEFLEKIE